MTVPMRARIGAAAQAAYEEAIEGDAFPDGTRFAGVKEGEWLILVVKGPMVERIKADLAPEEGS